MRKDLLRRLQRLEDRCQSTKKVILYWLSHRLDKARRESLAANERIVHDIYRVMGLFGHARERITTDPSDEGRCCESGGYLEDVIRELHEQCERRAEGGCGDCAGLEHLFATPSSLTSHKTGC